MKHKFSRERRQQLAEIIRAGSEQGVFADCDAGETSRVIFNLLRGYVVSMDTDEESLFSAKQGINLVLQGLLRRNSE